MWFLVAVGLALTLFTATELFWRSTGAEPSYIESRARWAAERSRLERSSHPRRTALIGSSRILFAFSLETFEKRYPGTPVAQLAIPATGPLATLKSFAYETDFDGVILFSFNPENLLPPREHDQEGYVEYYRSRWSLDQKLNFDIGSLFEPLLVTRHDVYSINRIVRRFLGGQEQPKLRLYLSVRQNRQHDADFSLTDPLQLQDNRIGAVVRRHDRLLNVIDKVWPHTLQALVDAVNAIHNRGGCVVFLRMPIVDRSLQQDQRIFAKSKYWDALLAELGVYGVHYDQIAGLDHIPLPDAEHIDARDQQRFTAALIDELDRLGIYDPAGPCKP